MKSKLIIIGTLAGIIALSLNPATVRAENPQSPATQPGGASTTKDEAETTLEGRIMPLHAFLAGRSAPGADTAPAAGRTATTLWPVASGTADQALVLVVASKMPTPSDPAARRTPGQPLTDTAAPIRTPSSSQPEAYVLVVDPADPGSRSAFEKAKAHARGTHTGKDDATGSDRLKNRGPKDTDPTPREPGAAPKYDAGADAGNATPSQRPGSPDAKALQDKGAKDTNLVKVTGKVLERGGIRAIEIASVRDAASMASHRPATTQAER